jgi:hypothetical protein
MYGKLGTDGKFTPFWEAFLIRSPTLLPVDAYLCVGTPKQCGIAVVVGMSWLSRKWTAGALRWQRLVRPQRAH